MSIERALDRFDAVMAEAWPSWLAQLQPGLNDDGIRALRSAVEPYLVPAQVDTLYRWRNGGDHGVFGGWRMRPLDELIDWYRFTYEKLESPRTWLPVFDDQIVNIVTLDIPSRPASDPSVWEGHTHDAWLSRRFDSIEALLDVVCDAAEAGLLGEHHGRLGLDTGDFAESLDGRAWDQLRLARCPGSFRWPDPPPGTYLSRGPVPEWPREWLVPLGVTDESLELRGATHTIEELVAAAEQAPIRGTIRGRVVTGSGGGGWWSPVVTDGTGEIVVSCETAVVPLTVPVGQEGEFDVVLESAARPEPIEDEDPRVVAIANRIRPVLPTARAIAARPIPGPD